MIATNHAMTGAAIGLAAGDALLAIPLAFASHFVLDALPHFGANISLKSLNFKLILAIDTLLCILLVVWLALSGTDMWLLASVCAFVAASPDFMWAPGFFRVLKGGQQDKEGSLIKKFHARIQWFQRPVGVVVEVVYGSTLLLTLVNMVNI